MNEKILNIATKKLKGLSKKYNNFLNIIVDDWRGNRFVFDTEDVRKCKNDCQNCPLFNLLKDEKEGIFSARLYPASKQDKKIFGPQNFLNCKTITRYQKCYINFLLYRTQTKKEIEDEINLIKNLKIIYSKNKNSKILEKKFKEKIFKDALRLSSGRKKEIIKKCLAK